MLATTLTLVVPAIREGQPSILLLAAVVASTCYGGQWPGRLATILAGIANTGFLLLRSGPRGLGPNDWMELGVFALVALGMNTFAAERGRVAGLLRRSRDDLEQCVGVRTSELLQANRALQVGVEVRQRAEEALSQFAAIEASAELRTLIWDLCPPMLHEVGLEAALEWLAEQIQERHGIDVRFEDDERPKASEENVRVLLFHAVHELLMNVINNAKASRVIEAVRRREEQVEIHVEDDGVGFDTEGMRVRVRPRHGATPRALFVQAGRPKERRRIGDRHSQPARKPSRIIRD